MGTAKLTGLVSIHIYDRPPFVVVSYYGWWEIIAFRGACRGKKDRPYISK